MPEPNLTRLVVLWLLSEAPLHGYQVKQTLADPGLQFWFPIEYGSIYSVLRYLHKSGYTRDLPAEREGRRPERIRYAITPKGRQYLARMLRAAWRQPAPTAQPIDVALAAIPELKEQEILGLLAARRVALVRRLENLDQIARSAPNEEMVRRARLATTAELKWVDELAVRLASAVRTHTQRKECHER